MKFKFQNVTDETLIAPVLIILINQENHTIKTSQLHSYLRKYFILNNEDKKKLKGRSDDLFSQKVRNIKSHKILKKYSLVKEIKDGFQMTDEGKNIANLLIENLKNKIANDEIITEAMIDKIPGYKNLILKNKYNLPFNPLLLSKVNNLNFSVRSINVFNREKIIYLGDLVQYSIDEFKKFPNMGLSSLSEINNFFKQNNLKFKSSIPLWNKENIKKYSKLIYQDVKKKYNKNIDKILEKFLIKNLQTKNRKKNIIREEQIIRDRFALGKEYCTLQKVGDKHKVTRERIRQISKNFIEKNKNDPEFVEALKNLLIEIKEITPISNKLLNKILIQKNIFLYPKTFSFLNNFITLIYGKSPFDISEINVQDVEKENTAFLISSENEKKILNKFITSCKRYTSKIGYCNFDKISKENLNKFKSDKIEIIKKSLQELENFLWFDEQNFLFLDQSEHRNKIINNTKKLLSINDKVSYETLSEALIQNYRIKSSPPKELLKKICKLFGYEVDDYYIYSNHKKNSLSILEKKIVKLFKENDDYLNLYQCVDLAPKYDLKTGSLFAYLYSKGIIKKIDENVFCLIGTEHNIEKINKAKNYIDKSKVKDEINLQCDWAKDQKILITFNFHKVLKTRGFIYMPTGFSKFLNGEFLCKSKNIMIKIFNGTIYNLPKLIEDFEENNLIKIEIDIQHKLLKIFK